ncbi:MAG: hypothetical protein AB9922_01935 [Bacteroidales bacterium]
MSETFLNTLKIMGIGMAGIFIFMLLFWIIITGLHKKFPGSREEQGEKL